MPSARYLDFQTFISGHTAKYLDEYVQHISTTRYQWRPREVNDPIWGTIVVGPAESAIIGSPLFQRLKETRQLGVAHHLYPSANHSRYEHSLGALHAVSTLLNVLDSRHRDSDDPPAAPDDLVPVIRLAALVHDIGHGALSHVTENALENTDWAEELIFEAGELHEAVDQNSLSEIAAIEMIQSQAFGRLLDAIVSNTSLNNSADIADKIVKSIAGYPIDDRFPFLSDLISGPFDADKLDYISRDSRQCGLPQVLDTQRLIRKIRSVRISRDDLPDNVGSRIAGSHASYTVTAIISSGASTLDELAMARALLHDKVYRHHKTRSFESIIAGMVELLIEVVPDGHHAPWQMTDVDLVGLRGEDLRRRFEIPSTARTRRLLRIYNWIQECYRRRIDYVAAYAWFIDLAGYGPSLHEEQKTAFHRLEVATRDIQRRFDVREAVVREFWRAFDLLDEHDRPDVPVENRADLRYLIQLDCVRAGSRLSRRSVLENAYVLDKRGRLIPFPLAASDSDALSGYYVSNRDVSFVFAPRALSPLVSIASEVVVHDLFGVRTTEAMRSKMHASIDETARLRSRLHSAGYFAGRPPHLEPIAPFLDRAATINRIERLAQSWTTYEPPYGGSNGQHSASLTSQDVVVFLRQFRDHGVAESCLVMLEAIDLLGRDDLRSALAPIIAEALSEMPNLVVSPLGGPDESGAHVHYAMTDVLGAHPGIRNLWADRLDDSCDGIVFLDDFIGSGSRLLGCLSGWLGVDIDGASSSRPGPLAEPAISALCSRPVVFAFARGYRTDYADIEAKIRSVGVNGTIRAGTDQIPTLSALQLHPTALSSLRQELARVGNGLMRSLGKSESEADFRELGTANWGLLFATSLNTPAQSVTALWASGQIDGFEWQPLFPRRP